MSITPTLTQLLSQELASAELTLANGDNITPLAILRYLPRNRLVLQGLWRDQQVAVKIFFHPYKAYWHWRREKRGLTILQQANINTPPLLFVGTHQANNAYLIVTAFINNAGHFEEQLPSIKASLLFLQQHIDMMIKLHQQGYIQHDWHVNNFLYAKEKIYAIDAGQIKYNFWQRKKNQLCNLALFFSMFPLGYHVHYKALYDYYCMKVAQSTNKKDYQFILNKVTYHQKNRWQQQIHKLFRSSTKILCEQSFSKRILRTKFAMSQHWDDLLTNPDSAFSLEAHYLKKGNSSTVIKTCIANTPYVIKRYNIKNKWHGFCRLWRSTRAANSWKFAHLLTVLGVKTPTPCAIVEQRFGPLRKKSYFISHWQSGLPLADYLPQANKEQQLHIAKQIIEIFKRWANAHIIHGDTKASNWLIHEDTVYVLDLDAMHQYKNLHNFHYAQQQEWQRFLKNWDNYPDILSLFNALK